MDADKELNDMMGVIGTVIVAGIIMDVIKKDFKECSECDKKTFHTNKFILKYWYCLFTYKCKTCGNPMYW